nr:MAG TPA_asm: hypothetical protein [Caudoviricetes sp.]
MVGFDQLPRPGRLAFHSSIVSTFQPIVRLPSSPMYTSGFGSV